MLYERLSLTKHTVRTEAFLRTGETHKRRQVATDITERYCQRYQEGSVSSVDLMSLCLLFVSVSLCLCYVLSTKRRLSILLLI